MLVRQQFLAQHGPASREIEPDCAPLGSAIGHDDPAGERPGPVENRHSLHLSSRQNQHDFPPCGLGFRDTPHRRHLDRLLLAGPHLARTLGVAAVQLRHAGFGLGVDRVEVFGSFVNGAYQNNIPFGSTSRQAGLCHSRSFFLFARPNQSSLAASE